MTRIQVRQTITLLISLSSIAALMMVWTGAIEIFGLREDSHPYVNTVLAVLVPATATFGIAALAIVFLTAQVSAAYGKPSVLRELYRSWDIYFLFSFIISNVVGGYLLFVLNTDLPVTILKARLLDTTLITSVATTLLVLPTIMSQVENLDPLILASKLVSRITPSEIKLYGLTEVQVAVSERTVAASYRLVTVSLRPSVVDPFRPMHEIIMDSVRSRDRVLFGKLFRYFLTPVARVHGAYWDPSTSDIVPKRARGRKSTRLKNAADSVHVTLAVVHYSVKRARNLLREWDGLDIGRHGIVTGLCDLVRSLAPVEYADASIRICLFGVLNLERFYAGVQPYGRVEPINGYFDAANELERFGKIDAAQLCVALLGWVSVHTTHLSNSRSPNPRTVLTPELHRSYETVRQHLAVNPAPHPMLIDDPWTDWPGN
jgi:hypothetical protein